jgi:hypothetical protein
MSPFFLCKLVRLSPRGSMGSTPSQGQREDVTQNGDTMALTREFKNTVAARAQRDPRFREALFTEALNAYFSGDTAVAKQSCGISSTPPLGLKN